MQVLQYTNDHAITTISVVKLTNGLNIGSKVTIQYSYDDGIGVNYCFYIQFTLVCSYTWRRENDRIYEVDREFYDSNHSVYDIVILYLEKLTAEKILE